jgi:hypothetical protein
MGVFDKKGGFIDMCSSCSNDDPRPEIVGGFAISSSVNTPVFAVRKGKRRKHYRTFPFLRDFRKPAFLQGFMGLDGFHGSKEAAIFAHSQKRDIDRPRGLASGENFGIEGTAGRERLRGISARTNSEPSEIRVSGDAIIEVHGTGLLRHVTWERLADDATLRRIEERGELPMLPAGDEYHQWLYRSAMRAQRIRIFRAIGAYTAFASAAALLIWFLLK